MIDGDDCVENTALFLPNGEHKKGGYRQFFRSLQDAFGNRFLFYLALTYGGLKGTAFSLTTAAMLPYFQGMHVSGSSFQLAGLVSQVPWCMKGWVGVLSDCVPLGRYHKRGYLMASTVIGIAGVSMLLCVPLEGTPAEVWLVAVLFCAPNIQYSTFDLLCEGKYSEKMRENGSGSEVLTLVWVSVQMGSVVAALLVGTFVDWSGPKPLLAICLPVMLLLAWRTALGDLPEEPARSWRSLRKKLFSEPRLFFLAGSMAAGSLAMAISAATLETGPRAIVALAVSGSLIWWSFRALPCTLARANLYMFLISVAYLDLSGPLAYFYTGAPSCVENGPGFSYSYYLAISNVVGSIGAAMGAVLFQHMQGWQFRSVFCVTTFVQIVASIFDLIIIKRWNIRLGVSDQAMYLFGDAACQSLAAQMALMPCALLTARLCPRGAEATVYAILAGFQNFGMTVGSIFGVQLSQAFGVYASKEGPCDFGELSTIVVLGHFVCPIICLPLVLVLVPVARVDDDGAFNDSSPPPSFRSPAPSPRNSEAWSADGWTQDDIDSPKSTDEYCLMHEEENSGMRGNVSFH